MGKQVYKAYKYRLYPNKEQETLLAKHFGCCRFIYNYFLEDRIKQHKDGNTAVSFTKQCKSLTQLKKDPQYSWLREVNSQSLQSVLANLDNAFQSYYQKKSNHPVFKKKKSRNTFCVPQYFFIRDGKLILPKFGKKNGIKIVQHRPIEGKLLFAKVSKSTSGKYYVSITTEQTMKPKVHPNRMIGLDLGITDLVITSDGEKFKNQKLFHQYEKQIAKAQRYMRRKQSGSNRFEKQRIKFCRLHEKVCNKRMDMLHKISRKLVDSTSTIFIEDLNITGLQKNHCMSKSIGDCSWYQLIELLKYKGQWENILIHKIPRFFASSKVCSHCGYKLDRLPLSIREWTCPQCGEHHDRDINAAKNILMKGIQDLSGEISSAGTVDYTNGGDVRPFSSKTKRAISNEVRNAV